MALTRIYTKKQMEMLRTAVDLDWRFFINHDLIVAGISIALLKMLRNQRRNELVTQMLPQYKFRRSIHGGDYVPIKHVGKELSINSYYQSEQYSEEQGYRDKSSKLLNEEELTVFKAAGIKEVTVVNEFTPCHLCKTYVGSTYPVDGAPDIPIHSDCRCRLMHVNEGLSGSDISLLLGALASVSALRNADKSSDKGVKEPDEDVIINEKELLPNLKNATFAEVKLTKYALDPTSDKGKEKARVFKAALGYEKSNYKDLMQQVYDNLGKFKAVEKGEDQYGTKFEVNMMIHGPNGKTKNVLTAWKVTWLTSIYVKDKG